MIAVAVFTAACVASVWVYWRWAQALVQGILDDLWHEAFDAIFN
jgi:hypothetical protein